MTKKVVIKSNNITPKQWSVLLLELNLMVQAWRPYAKIEIEATGLKKIISWGTRKHDDKE